MMLNIIEDFSFVEQELLTVEEWHYLEDGEAKEVVQGDNEEQEESESDITSWSELYGQSSLKKPHGGDLVPLHVKIKAVTSAQLHPTRSVKMMSSKTLRLLTSKTQLWRWKEQVERGKSCKYCMISSWTYDRFIEARPSKQNVTTRAIQ
jgi:hypothetical protein